MDGLSFTLSSPPEETTNCTVNQPGIQGQNGNLQSREASKELSSPLSPLSPESSLLPPPHSLRLVIGDLTAGDGHATSWPPSLPRKSSNIGRRRPSSPSCCCSSPPPSPGFEPAWGWRSIRPWIGFLLCWLERLDLLAKNSDFGVTLAFLGMTMY